jgi:predicted secreted protein
MTPTEFLVVYVIIWWLVLFMVLPFGISRVDPNELLPGQDPGSPAKGRMVLKLVITSVISLVLLGGYYLIATSGMISFREPM